MKKSILDELIDSALSIEYPEWKNKASTILLGFLCTAVAASFWFLFFTTEEMKCYKGFLYMSVFYYFAEILVISYIYKFRNIPKFARDTIGIVLAFSNIWFGLFIFSLKPCTT